MIAAIRRRRAAPIATAPQARARALTLANLNRKDRGQTWTEDITAAIRIAYGDIENLERRLQTAIKNYHLKGLVNELEKRSSTAAAAQTKTQQLAHNEAPQPSTKQKPKRKPDTPIQDTDDSEESSAQPDEELWGTPFDNIVGALRLTNRFDYLSPEDPHWDKYTPEAAHYLRQHLSSSDEDAILKALLFLDTAIDCGMHVIRAIDILIIAKFDIAKAKKRLHALLGQENCTAHLHPHRWEDDDDGSAPNPTARRPSDEASYIRRQRAVRDNGGGSGGASGKRPRTNAAPPALDPDIADISRTNPQHPAAGCRIGEASNPGPSSFDAAWRRMHTGTPETPLATPPAAQACAPHTTLSAASPHHTPQAQSTQQGPGPVSLAGYAQRAQQIIDYAVPLNTLAVDDGAMRRWRSFCAIMAIDSNRPDATDADYNHRTESDIMAAFLIYIFENMEPRSKSDPSPKPSSALAVVDAVRRVCRRRNGTTLPMPRLKQIVTGLEIAHIRVHGATSLLTKSKRPIFIYHLREMRAKAPGRIVHGRTVRWEDTYWVVAWAAIITMFYAGFRKSDAVPTKNTPFHAGCLSRASLTWVTMGNTRHAAIQPPCTKGDQTSLLWANDTITLPLRIEADPFDPAGPLLAACSAFAHKPSAASYTQLFAYSHTDHITGEDMDCIIRDLLNIIMPAQDAQDYSAHSLRIGAASTLLAAGMHNDIIKRTFRWRSDIAQLTYSQVNVQSRCSIADTMRSFDTPRTAPTFEPECLAARIADSLQGRSAQHAQLPRSPPLSPIRDRPTAAHRAQSLLQQNKP
jgi:hypothetical protein